MLRLKYCLLDAIDWLADHIALVVIICAGIGVGIGAYYFEHPGSVVFFGTLIVYAVVCTYLGEEEKLAGCLGALLLIYVYGLLVFLPIYLYEKVSGHPFHKSWLANHLVETIVIGLILAKVGKTLYFRWQFRKASDKKSNSVELG
jgi:hypothetical protein